MSDTMKLRRAISALLVTHRRYCESNATGEQVDARHDAVVSAAMDMAAAADARGAQRERERVVPLIAKWRKEAARRDRDAEPGNDLGAEALDSCADDIKDALAVQP